MRLADHPGNAVSFLVSPTEWKSTFRFVRQANRMVPGYAVGRRVFFVLSLDVVLLSLAEEGLRTTSVTISPLDPPHNLFWLRGHVRDLVVAKVPDPGSRGGFRKQERFLIDCGLPIGASLQAGRLPEPAKENQACIDAVGYLHGSLDFHPDDGAARPIAGKLVQIRSLRAAPAFPDEESFKILAVSDCHEIDWKQLMDLRGVPTGDRAAYLKGG